MSEEFKKTNEQLNDESEKEQQTPMDDENLEDVEIDEGLEDEQDSGEDNEQNSQVDKKDDIYKRIEELENQAKAILEENVKAKEHLNIYKEKLQDVNNINEIDNQYAKVLRDKDIIRNFETELLNKFDRGEIAQTEYVKAVEELTRYKIDNQNKEKELLATKNQYNENIQKTLNYENLEKNNINYVHTKYAETNPTLKKHLEFLAKDVYTKGNVDIANSDYDKFAKFIEDIYNSGQQDLLQKLKKEEQKKKSSSSVPSQKVVSQDSNIKRSFTKAELLNNPKKIEQLSKDADDFFVRMGIK